MYIVNILLAYLKYDMGRYCTGFTLCFFFFFQSQSSFDTYYGLLPQPASFDLGFPNHAYVDCTHHTKQVYFQEKKKTGGSLLCNFYCKTESTKSCSCFIHQNNPIIQATKSD